MIQFTNARQRDCPATAHFCCEAFIAWLVLAASVGAVDPHGGSPEKDADNSDVTEADPKAAARQEARLLRDARQLTFEGRRAGEGYFSKDGQRMIFQSEREPGNPFFQIYLMDLETGDVDRMSPGYGKTTCAWIHPDGNQVLFSSTHEDKEARKKQADELKLRASGKQRRYSWDYDEHYEVYVHDRTTGKNTNVTNTHGYDAEGSFAPDGRLIAFASNRQAYAGGLTDEQRKKFEHDPAVMMDIYLMNADGSNVRRLTESPGYDGGPFFSPDGKRICWRRFAVNGATAEIMTMNVDGSDQRSLTRLGAMSWAPFYHPSGEYLIFTTNLLGFANFELYLIDTEAKSQPLRVTYAKGFDGLPVFTPDGQQLAWTARRDGSKRSQIHLARWDHDQARKLLGLDGRGRDDVAADEMATAAKAAAEASKQTTPQFTPQDVRRHVEYLCRDELAGRLTGTAGERLATAYVAAYLDSLGLRPAGDDGTWYQNFEFTSGAALGKDNTLAAGKKQYEVDQDWVPVSFAKTGKVAAAPVVFAGYGLVAPASDGQPEYDSFVHLDVTDKWVLVFRYIPEDISPERRQHLGRHSVLRYKAMVARDKGARGLIVVTGPHAKVKSQLVRLRFDGSLSGASIPVISVTDALAQQWLDGSSKKLDELQDTLDKGDIEMGFELKDVRLSASIDIRRVKKSGRNVLGRLSAGTGLSAKTGPSEQAIIIGAHVDHLGTGPSGHSLARENEKSGIHYGADDNASGVAALMEIAEYLADQKAHGRLKLRRDVIFAAWSGEELGTLGSNHFVKTFKQGKLYPTVAACLNMDMVGRLDDKLTLFGIGSSGIWPGEIEQRNAPVGLPIAMQNESYLPTDATAFYMKGVPILAAFTGAHGDYHTPRDTPDKLNYEGAARIARLMGLVTRSLAMRDAPPDYVVQKASSKGPRRANLRAYLGTIPDYTETDVKGLKITGVAKGGPADKAGIRGGDVIVELAGKKIDNIYDYTYAIEALKIGQTVKIVVARGGKRVEMKLTPGSRE